VAIARPKLSTTPINNAGLGASTRFFADFPDRRSGPCHGNRTGPASIRAVCAFVDLDHTQAMDALIAGKIDVAILPQSQLDGSPLQQALDAPGIRLMSVAQAEAIAKTVPGLKVSLT
jgi:hypothetical protein